MSWGSPEYRPPVTCHLGIPSAGSGSPTCIVATSIQGHSILFLSLNFEEHCFLFLCVTFDWCIILYHIIAPTILSDYCITVRVNQLFLFLVLLLLFTQPWPTHNSLYTLLSDYPEKHIIYIWNVRNRRNKTAKNINAHYFAKLIRILYSIILILPLYYSYLFHIILF